LAIRKEFGAKERARERERKRKVKKKPCSSRRTVSIEKSCVLIQGYLFWQLYTVEILFDLISLRLKIGPKNLFIYIYNRAFCSETGSRSIPS